MPNGPPISLPAAAVTVTRTSGVGAASYPIESGNPERLHGGIEASLRVG